MWLESSYFKLRSVLFILFLSQKAIWVKIGNYFTQFQCSVHTPLLHNVASWLSWLCDCQQWRSWLLPFGWVWFGPNKGFADSFMVGKAPQLPSPPLQRSYHPDGFPHNGYQLDIVELSQAYYFPAFLAEAATWKSGIIIHLRWIWIALPHVWCLLGLS